MPEPKFYVVEVGARPARWVEGTIAHCIAWIKREPAGNGRFAILPPDRPAIPVPPSCACRSRP